LTPLAPTIHEYSELFRQRRRQAVTLRVLGQVDRSLLKAEDLDPLGERIGDELAPAASGGFEPSAGPTISDGDGKRRPP
jgi:hypothetical protein